MHKFFSFFRNRYFNQHLGNIFRMSSFDSETFQSDILNLNIKFRYFLKKLEVSFLQYICLLAQKLPPFLPRSSNIAKPLLVLCRMDPGDAFTYLSWYHIMSTSNFRIRENFFHFSLFMHISLWGTSKRSLRNCFQLISNIFVQIFKFWTWAT